MSHHHLSVTWTLLPWEPFTEEQSVIITPKEPVYASWQFASSHTWSYYWGFAAVLFQSCLISSMTLFNYLPTHFLKSVRTKAQHCLSVWIKSYILISFSFCFRSWKLKKRCHSSLWLWLAMKWWVLKMEHHGKRTGWHWVNGKRWHLFFWDPRCHWTVLVCQQKHWASEKVREFQVLRGFLINGKHVII